MKRIVFAWLLALASGAAAQSGDPQLGTWKMNRERSTGSVPQSLTLTVELDGTGMRNTAEGLTSGGRLFKIRYTAYHDGQDWPVTGYSVANSASFRRIDVRTTERIDKFNGRVVQTARREVSEDGRSMTVKHSPSGAFFFYEKQ